MKNCAYVSYHPVHAGKSENLSKISSLVIVQVICIYAVHFPAPKEGEPEAWQFPFLKIKEEKQTETVTPKDIVVACAEQQRKVLIWKQNKYF